MIVPPRTGPRLEVKHHLPVEEASELREWIAHELAPDPHARDPDDPVIPVASLYFDSPGRICYRDRAPHKLPKHRLRQYDGCSAFYLEEKLRVGERVWKRRLPVPEERLEAILHGTQPLDDEYEWFRSRFRILNLMPTLMIAYHRRAFVADGGGRVTFDEHITASRVSPRFLEFRAEGQAWGLTEQIVLEVKTPLERSPFMEHVARRVQQAVRACSKYCLGLEAAGLEVRPERRHG